MLESGNYPKKNLIFMGWVMWIIAALFYTLDYFQHTAPSVLIKPISESLGVSYIHIGNIMSIYFPIYAVSQIPAGIMIDRIGLKKALSLACFITSIGLLTMSVPSNLMLITGRILIAFGSAFAFIGALKTADIWLSKKVFPLAVGITNTIGVAGGILGQPVLQKLITFYSWQTAILYISLCGFALSLFILIFLYTPKEKLIKHGKLEFKIDNISIFKDKNLYFIALYAGIMVGTVVNAFSELYDVVFLQESFNISAEQSSFISSLVFVGIAIGGPSHGYIVRFFKNNKKIWMLICCFATIISFTSIIILANFKFHMVLISIAYLLSGFFVSSMLLSFAIARNGFDKAYHGKIFALINTLIGVCGFLFQLLLGKLIKYTSHIFTTPENHKLVFLVSCLGLLIPLIISFILCLKIKEKKAAHV